MKHCVIYPHRKKIVVMLRDRGLWQANVLQFHPQLL